MSKPVSKQVSKQESSTRNHTFQPYRTWDRNRRTPAENSRSYGMQYPVHMNNYKYYSARPTRFFRGGYLNRNRSVQNVKRKPRKLPEKKYSRPPSPSVGNKEEDKLRRIRETSDMIKELMMSPKLNVNRPPSESTSQDTSADKENTAEDVCAKRMAGNDDKARPEEKLENRRIVKSNSSKGDSQYSVEEIHNKIIKHISNLSYKRKMKLISSAPVEYNIVFDQIAKQKQLELSKALRDMCSEPSPENTEQISSMMPDFDIKIEELPISVIQLLSNTLGLDFENNDSLQPSISLVKVEPLDNDQEVHSSQNNEVDDSVVIKKEWNEFEDSFEINQSINELPLKQKVNAISDFERSQDDTGIIQMNSQAANITSLLDNTLVEDEVPHCSEINMLDSARIKSEVDEPKDCFDNYDFNYESFDEMAQESSRHFEQQTISEELDINRNNENLSNDQFVQKDDPNPLDKMQLDGSSGIEDKTNCTSTQTDCGIYQSYLTDSTDPARPRTLEEAVSLMYDIDKEIFRLTELRQSLFTNLSRKDKEVSVQPNPPDLQVSKSVNSKSVKRKLNKKWKKKAKRFKESKVTCNEPEIAVTTTQETPAFDFNYDKELSFDIGHEQILDVKVYGKELACVSESGQLFFVDMKDGKTLQKIKVTDNGCPATSVCFWKSQNHIFVGGFDSSLKEYDLKTRMLMKCIPVVNSGSQLQITCLELCWNFVFIGTSDGVFLRYSLIKSKVEFSDKISESSLLVLKGTQEGARRILIIGSRNSPVCIRDAMSGLHMRVMDRLLSPTVYSLILKKHLVYCGTTSHEILVFNFHDGTLVRKYPVAGNKSIGCMKVVNKLLYASCHNGSIYIYNTELHKCVGCIKGPGGIILSMEVVGNLIIAGTMARNFESIIIPADILNSNK